MDDFNTPYSPLEMSRQIRGLKGDKRMTELAVNSMKENMANLLKGEMGNDMKEILGGNKQIELPPSTIAKYKLVSWFKRLLRKF